MNGYLDEKVILGTNPACSSVHIVYEIAVINPSHKTRGEKHERFYEENCSEFDYTDGSYRSLL